MTATSTVLVCRGCCCGTEKHPDFDHAAQLAELRAASDEDSAGRIRVTQCLGPCGESNVIAVRHRDTERSGVRVGTTWFGGVLTTRLTADLAGWVSSGAAPETLPASLLGCRLDPDQVIGGVTPDHEVTFLSFGGSPIKTPSTQSSSASPTENSGVTNMPIAPVGSVWSAAVKEIVPVAHDVASEAQARSDRQTKPAGSLGALESIGAQLAAIARVAPAPVPSNPAVVVFAGDHGVHVAGVTPWPQEVTAQMVMNFTAGGAAINAFARQVGASVTVVDVGVAADLSATLDPSPTMRLLNVARGTANLANCAAMTAEQVNQALDVGASVAADMIEAGSDVLVTGDMGIANTTASAALIAAFTGQPAAQVTGRGTGIDDATLERKTAVVHNALQRLHPNADPLEIAAEVGGLEIVAIAGFILGVAAAKKPVIVDGVISLAGLCIAHALCAESLGYVIAGHRSTEPGASAALTHLGLSPLLDLSLRLGEGTGACLAVPLVQSAARALADMATFDSAGVSDQKE